MLARMPTLFSILATHLVRLSLLNSVYLCAVAMHGAGPYAHAIQHIGHEVARVLPGHKDEDQVAGRGEPLPEQLHQLLVLVLA